MKRSEWIECLALMRLNWPHVAVDEAVAEKWFSDLADLPADQVKVGIEALYRDGREFPPNGAQIRAKVAELSHDDGDWGEAWALAKRANRKADPRDGWAWLEQHCPAAADAVRRLDCGAPGVTGAMLSYLLADEPTVRAQFRDIYKSLISTRRRDDTYAGLPSAGLRRLERGPRKLGSALERALPKGRPAELEAPDRETAA